MQHSAWRLVSVFKPASAHLSVLELTDLVEHAAVAADIKWPVPENAVVRYLNRIRANFDYNHLTTFLRVSSRWATIPAGAKLDDVNDGRPFIYVRPEQLDTTQEPHLNIIPYETFYVAALWDEDETRLAMIRHPDGIQAIKDRIFEVKLAIEKGEFHIVKEGTLMDTKVIGKDAK